jgi:hypothetical protein
VINVLIYEELDEIHREEYFTDICLAIEDEIQAFIHILFSLSTGIIRAGWSR